MGTADIAERELVQGLIKLAAGFVHAARRNPAGITKNLVGARAHLAASGPAAGPAPIAVPELAAIDVGRLMRDIDRVVARVARDGEVPRRRPAIRQRATS